MGGLNERRTELARDLGSGAKAENETFEIMNENWLELDGREIKDKFNLVICSHFLWQMKDLEKA